MTEYFFPDAAAACRFTSHIKQSGKGKLSLRYRWPDEVRDDVLARILPLPEHRMLFEYPSRRFNSRRMTFPLC